jgi:hypothetical protein
MTLAWNGDWEVREADIPCPGGARRNILDMREPQQTLGEHRGRMTAQYDAETGELTFVVGSTLPSPSDLLYFAADYRKRPAGLTAWTFIVPNTAEDAICWLSHKGFVREDKSTGTSGIAFTKHYSRRHGNTDTD